MHSLCSQQAMFILSSLQHSSQEAQPFPQPPEPGLSHSLLHSNGKQNKLQKQNETTKKKSFQDLNFIFLYHPVV